MKRNLTRSVIYATSLTLFVNKILSGLAATVECDPGIVRLCAGPIWVQTFTAETLRSIPTASSEYFRAIFTWEETNGTS